MWFFLGISTACLAAAAAVTASAQTFTDAPAAGTAPSRGQLLYDTHCIQCHTSQIHWRDARAARDWATLRAEVARWQGQTGRQWPDEDIDAVARYLNATIYHFPLPQRRG